MTRKPTGPPAARRDPRSDPDDDTAPSPPTSQRIDVVNVGAAGGDSISAVANTMRRELAKLHQQASAFERTVEDQRRERAEALDRAERAVEHALSLEARLSRMEAETLTLRRMHETALEDLQKMQKERDAHAERAAAIERENIDLRLAEERMRRELEGALQAAMHAEARAGVAERARIQVEDGVRQLRDELTTAFARLRLVAPSLAPAPAEALSSRIAASVPPPPREASSVPNRDELIAKLIDANDASGARSAADALKSTPEWLRGAPPKELLGALARADYDADRPEFEVARAWEREPLCSALLDALRGEQDSRPREHAAWLLEHFAAPSSWQEIAALAKSDAETIGVRRWLLEALDRLVAGRFIGWNEVGDLVTSLAKHPDATLRDGNIGIVSSLERSHEKKNVLVDILAHEDDEVVLASAIDALAASSPDDVDERVLGRLLEHPSDRVQRAAKDLLAKNTEVGATIDVD